MAFRVLAKKDMELCESPVIEHDFSLRPLCQLREDKVPKSNKASSFKPQSFEDLGIRDNVQVESWNRFVSAKSTLGVFLLSLPSQGA